MASHETPIELTYRYSQLSDLTEAIRAVELLGLSWVADGRVAGQWTLHVTVWPQDSQQITFPTEAYLIEEFNRFLGSLATSPSDKGSAD